MLLPLPSSIEQANFYFTKGKRLQLNFPNRDTNTPKCRTSTPPAKIRGVDGTALRVAMHAIGYIVKSVESAA